MPDLSKKNMRVVLDLSVVSVARLHKYYLSGFEWTIASEEEVRKAMEFIENLEKLLLRTGYLNESEIKQRHTRFHNQGLKNESNKSLS